MEKNIWQQIDAGEVARERQFRIWACGDSHVHTDLRFGYESLITAIRQSEFGDAERGAPPMDWDIALHVGDTCGGQLPPTDEEGEEVLRQFGALKQHRRENVYNILGNHDASGPNEPTQWWFKKWIDPTGDNPGVSGVRNEHRPFPVTGTWERYAFEAGNLLFLMMGDRNDGGPPVGRGEKGGYPAGAVTEETFEWWKEQVMAHPEKIILTAHHHMLKETTVASGPYEGYRKDEAGNWKSHYHGYFADGAPEGASYLYFVGGQPDAEAFEQYLEANPGATTFWLGGHTHTHPDDTYGGRSHVETKWGTHFINCAAITKHHAGMTSMPMSRLLTFVEGHDAVRVQCYLHTDDHAPTGWYAPAERILPLGRPVSIP